MHRQILVFALGAWLSATVATAVDTVSTGEGKVIGKVTQMTPNEVTVEQGGGAKTVPVNEIETIYFEDEPAALRNARNAANVNRFDEVLELLEKVDLEAIERAELKQEIQFYQALAAARLAMQSADPQKVAEAGRTMYGFVRANPNNYHYYQANELVGDLLIAAGKAANAQISYNEVAKAPWPEYKMRAGVAIGRALLAQNKPDEALKTFQTVIEMDAKGESADAQRIAARLGKARCLAEGKQADEAIKLAQEVIDKTEAEQADLNAQAYNVLGLAHRKAGRDKDALWAFLHVDILYPGDGPARIEALRNLIPLWKASQKPERAAEAERILKEEYGVTP